MRLPDDTTKFSHRWKYIELARFAVIDGRQQVIREMTGPKDNRVPRIFEWKDVNDYRIRHDNKGLYSSVFNYDNTDIGLSSRLGSLYFDLDSSEGETARLEAVRLVQLLRDYVPEEGIRIYFTGKKGFHIECEALCLGITGSKDLADIFRFAATDIRDTLSLTTMDFAVYDIRRMWRLPNSQHQHTGLFKVPLSQKELEESYDNILVYAQQPREMAVPEQSFSSTANEWYRNYVYGWEASKQPRIMSSGDLLERFKKHGSLGTHNVNAEKVFDPKGLFEGCPAIIRLWEKAEREHQLEHEERLFLCSILSYTDEAIYYLHEILKNTTDYKFEITQAHIDDWVRRRELNIGGRPYSCERANAVGVGCGNCNLEPKKKWVRVGDKWVETEEESKPSPVRFGYQYKENYG